MIFGPVGSNGSTGIWILGLGLEVDGVVVLGAVVPDAEKMTPLISLHLRTRLKVIIIRPIHSTARCGPFIGPSLSVLSC